MGPGSGSGGRSACAPRACPLAEVVRHRDAGMRAHRDCELVPLELQVDPRLEGLVLHALAHRLPRAPTHASHTHTHARTPQGARTSACAVPVSPWSPCRGKDGWLAQWEVQWRCASRPHLALRPSCSSFCVKKPGTIPAACGERRVVLLQPLSPKYDYRGKIHGRSQAQKHHEWLRKEAGC